MNRRIRLSVWLLVLVLVSGLLQACAFGKSSSSQKASSKESAAGKGSAIDHETLEVKGRHDPCIVVRAVPVVEAAAAIACYDAMLGRKKEI